MDTISVNISSNKRCYPHYNKGIIKKCGGRYCKTDNDLIYPPELGIPLDNRAVKNNALISRERWAILLDIILQRENAENYKRFGF